MSADEFWVFGYGSLMWRPGFAFEESHTALLRGYHRSMCILSIHHRGTPEKPGLVLGLDRGGACRGMAFRVHPGEQDAVRAYLYEREMVTDVYKPRTLGIRLQDGRSARALCFVVERSHEQYLPCAPDEAARLIVQGRGDGGTARDYLSSTIDHLAGLGLRDSRLETLLSLVDALSIEA